MTQALSVIVSSADFGETRVVPSEPSCMLISQFNGSRKPTLFAFPVPNESSLRLVGGGVHWGRLEIFYNATWFSLCGRSWSDADAHVACRQLGMAPGSTLDTALSLSEDSPWLLTDTQCTGNEKRLSDCIQHGATDSVNCTAELAAVMCTGKLTQRL